MTHDDYKELLAAKALTALDAEDASLLDSHLQTCTDCRSKIGEWEETAAYLSLEATALEPSRQLRDRILASVRAEPPSTSATKHHDAAAKRAGANSKVIPFERSPRNIWTSLGSFGAVAAILVLVALIVSLVVLWQQNRATRQELVRLSNEMQQAKAQLNHERAVVQFFTSPDARITKLTGTNVAPGAQAMLAYDKNGHAMLMAKGLPEAPQGKAYQLWYIMGGKPMPGKMLTTDQSGIAILEDQIPAAALEGAVFAVTLEPEGGMPAPTGAIYLRSAA